MLYHSFCSSSSSTDNPLASDLTLAAVFAVLLGHAYQCGRLRNSNEGYILFHEEAKAHSPVSKTENVLDLLGVDESMASVLLNRLDAAYCVIRPTSQACYAGTWRDDGKKATVFQKRLCSDKAYSLISLGRSYLEFGGLDGAGSRLKKFLLVSDPSLKPIEDVMQNMMS